MHLVTQARWLVPLVALVALLALPPTALADSVVRTKTPIRVVAEEVIDDLFDRFWKKPSPVSRDLRTRRGLLGLGAYRPRGMIDGGLKAPPIHIVPSARVGNSLNVDPTTGRSFFQ